MEGQGVYRAVVANIKPGYSRYENPNLDVEEYPSGNAVNRYYEQLRSEGIPGNISAEHIVAKFIPGYIHMPKTFDGLLNDKLCDVKLMHPKQLSEYIAWKSNPEIDLSNKQAYFMQNQPHMAIILCVTKVMNGDMPGGAHGRWKQPYTIHMDVLSESGVIQSFDPMQFNEQEHDWEVEQAMIRALEDDNELLIGPVADANNQLIYNPEARHLVFDDDDMF